MIKHEPGFAALEKDTSYRRERSRNNYFRNNQLLTLFLELPPPAAKIIRDLEKK